jgi:hypothetical protein
MNLVGSQRSLGEFSTVPEKYQDAVRAGICFFELRLKGKDFHGRGMFGPYGVECKELEDAKPNAPVNYRFSIRWITNGNVAGIRFEPAGKNGLSVAFMPDDPWWHNRSLLLENTTYEVVAYHTPNGSYPAADIMVDIDAFREVIMESKTRYFCVDSVGRLVAESWDEKEIAKKVEDNPGSTVRTRKLWEKTNEIKTLIVKNKGIEYGWTNSPEFQLNIKPKIMKLAEERARSIAPARAEPQKSILEQLRDMAPEERKEFFAMMKSAGATEEPEAAPSSDRRTVSVLAPSTKRELLLKRAQALGIAACEGMTKAQLAEAITTAQGGDNQIPIEEPEPEVVT